MSFHIIVGDDYGVFAQSSSSTKTFSEMMLALDRGASISKDDMFVFGHGMSTKDFDSLNRKLKTLGAKNIQQIKDFAAPALTHKVCAENALITHPEKIDQHKYKFDLKLTDALDRLSDHVTGRHIGGMLLMEAARQAGTAVLELEYCSTDAQLGFVLKRFESEFYDYVFPMPASIEISMIELEGNKSKSIELAISFIQSGCEVSRMGISVKLFDSSFLESIEAKNALKAINYHVNVFNSEKVAVAEY